MAYWWFAALTGERLLQRPTQLSRVVRGERERERVKGCEREYNEFILG